ncbi:MAG: hypothetical protein ACLSGF_00390 [Alistipes onderdonkii]
MNKLYAILGVLLLTVSSVSAQKSGTDSRRASSGESVAIETITRDSLGIDTLRRIDTVDNGLVTLRDGGRDGSMVLEVAGFGLRLGHTPMQKMEVKSPRVWLNLLSDMEFGFTQLTGVDYSGYAPGEAGFLDQRLGPSFHFSFSVMQICLSLNRSRTLSLGLGLQYTLDNIRLADSGITLGNIGGRLVPVALDEPADKSKVVTSSLGIPVRLIYEPVRNASGSRPSPIPISCWGRMPSIKNRRRSTVCPDSGHTSSAWARRFPTAGSVFIARYGVTPLFKKGGGPECHTLSFGISLLM